MKRIIVFISVIIALLSVIIVYRVHETETKKLEAEKKELEELYYDQNTAWGILSVWIGTRMESKLKK